MQSDEYQIYNARILTMEPGREVFYGEVWVKNDKIAYVAEQKELAEEWDKSQFPRIAWDIELDCKGNLLMPGFKNAHTHSGMTFLRSMADDLPLDQWLNKQVFPLEAKLTGEDIYELTRLAVLEYLTSGVTSIFDMYLTPDTIAEACLDTGMRCVLVSGLNNFSSSPKQVEEEFLKWNKKNSLISYQLGFHAEYTCSKELLWKVSEMAHHYRTPVYAHISETEKEVEECKARYGMTPPMFLDSLGMFDFGGGGFHCVHVTEQDMDVFRRHRMYVITNPGSNTKLASGIAPIADYVRHKIPVAIGTDGPASNNCLDMFREDVLSHRLKQTVREGCVQHGCRGGTEDGNGERCQGNAPEPRRCSCKGKICRSYYDRSAPAQYAAHSQHPQESGLQRQQVQCLHDHDRRQDFVS